MRMEYPEATGVVLAGGRSMRMGRDKAALPIGGEPLIRRAVTRLRLAVPRVVVIGPRALQAYVPDVEVFADCVAGLGPLGGFITALGVVRTPWLFLVACDMPFVAPALVRAMLDSAAGTPDADAVVLRTPRGREPLHAVYGRAHTAEAVETYAAEDGRSLQELLRRLTVREMSLAEANAYDPSGLSAFNANTPEEWARAIALVGMCPGAPSI